MSRSEPLGLSPPSTQPEVRPAAASAVVAQLSGQAGARRGLREGEAALKRARAAYLATEWSGPDDRRPPAGLLVRGRL